MNWIKKLIPAYLEIRSLYWVEYGQRMDQELEEIFKNIDEDNFVPAQDLILSFESTYIQNGVPNWIAVKFAQIHRAQSMLHFLCDETISSDVV
jgi:hypothetical protein